VIARIFASAGYEQDFAVQDAFRHAPLQMCGLLLSSQSRRARICNGKVLLIYYRNATFTKFVSRARRTTKCCLEV
jgi:hypothetical protein